MALILTRRIEETLIVGDDIVVTILGVDHGQGKVGISAPKEVEIHREEVYKRIHCESPKNSISTFLKKSWALGMFSNSDKKKI